MDITYWPFWVGGLALASVAVGYRFLLGRSLGVSGAFADVLMPTEVLDADKAQELFDDERALELSMLRETLDEVRKTNGDTTSIEGAIFTLERQVSSSTTGAIPSGFLMRETYGMRVLFVAGVFAGGLLAALTSGGFGSMDFGPTFSTLFGSGFGAVALVFVGGLLVGFGTQMAGGCTSGHGLVGCARLQTGSLVATASFFGTAIVVSLILTTLLGAK